MDADGRRGGSWGGWVLVGLVLLTWAATALLGAVGGVLPARDQGTPLTAEGTDAQVVLVGIPGLTWDLVDETRTPTLARLAREGGAAALVVRGTHEVTCASDAWLTLGAGQRAATDVAGCGDAPEAEAEPVDPVSDGAVDPGRWHEWQEAGERRALGPVLGTLAELAEAGGTCVTSDGDDAVLGAARADGTSETGAGAACRIRLVSAPEILEADRSDQLPGVDALLADLAADLPDGATLVVAGLGHTAGRPEAQVLVVAPVDVRDGAGATLSSGSTRQRSLVQLTDLTPTLLSSAGIPPGDVLAGKAVTATAQVGDHVAQARDLAAGISGAKWQAPWVLGTILLLVLVALAAAGLLARSSRPVGAAVARVVAVVALAVPVATFAVGLVPWWRAGQPYLALIAGTLLIAGFVAAVALAGPWRRDPLAPAAVVAAVTMALVGADLLASSRLGLISMLGLQPVTAGRFYGQGNVGFGLVLGCFLVLAAFLLGRMPGRQAALAVALVGGALTAVDAAPGAGADFGGVPSMVIATGLLVLTALGLRWRPRSLLLLSLVGVVVAGAVMMADWARGPERRTHLGQFVQSVLDGEAWGIVTRKLAQSLGILASYPVSWLAVVALVVVACVVVTRRPAWTAPLWREPGLRPALLAGLVAMVVAWALNDSGIATVALTLAVLIAAGLSVIYVIVRSPTELGPAAS